MSCILRLEYKYFPLHQTQATQICLHLLGNFSKSVLNCCLVVENLFFQEVIVYRNSSNSERDLVSKQTAYSPDPFLTNYYFFADIK